MIRTTVMPVATSKFLSIVFVIAALAGCSHPTAPSAPSAPLSSFTLVDGSPAWSPDGAHVAFQRFYSSPYGPPGLYLIAVVDSVPQLLSTTPHDDLSFAPGGSGIVCDGPNGITWFDVASRAERVLVFSDEAPAVPRVSPDGETVAYARRLLHPGEPPDSSGLHLYVLATGSDTVVRDRAGGVVFGDLPQWSPDGTSLAYVRRDSLFTVRLADSVVTLLGVSRPNSSFDSPHWAASGGSILVSMVGSTGASYRYDLRSAGPTRLPYFLGQYAEFSPGDTSVVFVDADPAEPNDPKGVLYVRRFGDTSGASTRMLTHYAGPLLPSVHRAPD